MGQKAGGVIGTSMRNWYFELSFLQLYQHNLEIPCQYLVLNCNTRYCGTVVHQLLVVEVRRTGPIQTAQRMGTGRGRVGG